MKRSKKSRRCPRCSSRDVLIQDTYEDGIVLYVCADCDHEFEVRSSRSRRRGQDYDDDVNYDQEFPADEYER